jgi:hypothetical protein
VSALCVLAVVVTACGDNPLSGFGEDASGWIDGEDGGLLVTSSSSTLVASDADLRAAAGARWYNDELGVPEVEGDAAVVQVVWNRSEPGDSFVQASRYEIAAAVPGIQFPSLVPKDVEYITSQLVYDAERPVLDDQYVAAFGLWLVSPYSKSRSTSQPAVVWIGRDNEPAALDRIGGTQTTTDSVVDTTVAEPSDDRDPSQGCSRFSDRVLDDCEVTYLVGNTPAWWLRSSDGDRLVWVQDDLRYEIAYREFVEPAVVRRMANSMAPLVG